jgi:Icc-related predicted phosphoesterase
MELLVFGDTHIKPTDEAVHWDKLSVPSEVDAVVSVGDVIHDAREGAIEYAQRFFEELARPVIAVPGNHDPVEYYPEILDGISNAVNVHNSEANMTDVPGELPGTEPGYTFVGWGCEEFDQRPEIRPHCFPYLSPKGDKEETRYLADQLADRIEEEVYLYLTTDRTEKELLSKLDITDENQREFLDQLSQTVEVFETVSSLIESAEGKPIVVSHVPPYNTKADRHHSIGEREMDIEGFHVGSLELKLALRVHQPLAAFHGHSHAPVPETGFGESDSSLSLNPGYQGIVRVSFDEETGGFSFRWLNEG